MYTGREAVHRGLSPDQPCAQGLTVHCQMETGPNTSPRVTTPTIHLYTSYQLNKGMRPII